MKNVFSITTHTIKTLIRKRNKVEEIQDKIRLLKNELEKEKIEVQSDEEMMIGALKRGVEVMSKMFTAEVKEHKKMGYINWQQEFKKYMPKEYNTLKEVHDQEANWDELLIARR